MMTVTFASWEQAADHLRHMGLTDTALPCHFYAWFSGRWTPTQDLTACTCGLRDVIEQAMVTDTP